MKSDTPISLIIPVYSLDKEADEMAHNAFNSAWFTSEGYDLAKIAVDDAGPVPFYNAFGATITLGKNHGYAYAVNRGLEAAGGDVLIVGNSDLTFNPGWLEGLLKGLERYDIASIRVSDSDGWDTEDKFTDDDYFGSLWAMKRKVYDTIGGFDESFRKGSFEDKDYYNRAKEAGFTIGKYHGAMVEHIGRATNDRVFPNREDNDEGSKIYLEKYGRID